MKILRGKLKVLYRNQLSFMRVLIKNATETTSPLRLHGQCTQTCRINCDSFRHATTIYLSRRDYVLDYRRLAISHLLQVLAERVRAERIPGSVTSSSSSSSSSWAVAAAAAAAASSTAGSNAVTSAAFWVFKHRPPPAKKCNKIIT